MTPLKIISSLLLVLFVITVLIGTAIIYLVKFENQSFEGIGLKTRLIRYPFLVRVLQMNEPGDLRYAYLNANNAPLSVVVGYNQRFAPDEEAVRWIKTMMVQTGSTIPEITLVPDLMMPANEQLTNSDLTSIRSALVNRYGDRANVVFIIYAGSYAETPSNAGVTIHRDTMFIFQSTISGLTSDSAIRKRLERSTLMHEWGHLVGLAHIEFEHCIMNEKVEISSSYQVALGQTPVEYCVDEMRKLEQL